MRRPQLQLKIKIMKSSLKIRFPMLLVFLCILGRGEALRAQEEVEGLFYMNGNPVSVEIREGKISSVREIKKLRDGQENVYIAPGLFDNQVNGFYGVSFGYTGGGLTVDEVQKATGALWKRGVTTYLPTVTTNSHEALIRSFKVLAKAKDDPEMLGSIPGFHLEGPYISPVDGYRGAHSKKYVRKPDWDEFMELYRASGEGILTVTLAPEIEGAMDFIRKCTEMGIVVALGHHNGNAEQIREAAYNGARICTHLGNGCANMINRHQNPLWPQLANDRLMISIICDGFHLRPEEIKTFISAKGVDRTIITSDVTKFAGLEPGIYKNIDGDDLELTPEGELRYPAQKVLAGSASSIDKGVGHVMEVTGCSLASVIQMASTNPANLYGLSDRGTIEPGKRADLIVFTIENSKLRILKTYVKGKLVYEAGK